MDEKIYCPFCGAENSKEQKRCSACRKELYPKPYGLKNYLYDTTRDDLKGRAESSFFEILKNWILSHAYGLVVAIALVSLAVIVVRNNTNPLPSYIEPWKGAAPAVAASASAPETNEPAAAETDQGISEQDKEQIYQQVYQYSMAVSVEAGAFVEDEEGGEILSAEAYLLPAEYGERGPVDYTSTGSVTREVMSYAVDTRLEIQTVNAPAGAIGQALMAKGLPAVEVYFSEMFLSEDETSVVYTRSYQMTLAKAADTWYIAEMRQVEG